MPTMDPHMPQDAGQQEPDGCQLAVPDGSPVMPENIVIGTASAFHGDYAYKDQKQQVGNETIYVCKKGSEWAQQGEVLVLRCDLNCLGDFDCPGTWTAWDGHVIADGSTLQCRQPVSRCLATDITQPGWHEWETNHVASPSDAGLAVDWQGVLWAETRVP